MVLEPGKSLSYYTITSQLGKDGMGEVYQATDTKYGREVAIKVLPDPWDIHPDGKRFLMI
ncbi:MAG: hypothetical protein P8Z37_05930 [Acidobacteriota bacterium]|jgi:hypothetical protein